MTMEEKIARYARIAIIAIVCAGGLYALVRGGVHYYRAEKLRQELMQQEIYEVYFTYVANQEHSETYYMVCEPPEDRTELRQKVDAFLEENNIIAQVEQRARELVAELGKEQEKDYQLQSYDLTFLEPSKDLKIGQFPDDIYDGEYSVGQHVLFTLFITPDGQGQYQIEEFWPEPIVAEP